MIYIWILHVGVTPPNEQSPQQKKGPLAMRLRLALMALTVAIGLAAGVLLTTASTASACDCTPGWHYYHGVWYYDTCARDGGS